MKKSKKPEAKQAVETLRESKDQLIVRLVAKASLDFKCCGHGGKKARQ